MRTILLFCLFAAGLSLPAQVAINSDGCEPDSSAMLDVKSTTKGVLIPRMTNEQIAAIVNPANGLLAFCTTDSKLYIYLSPLGQWKELDLGTATVQPPFYCGNPITVNHVAGSVSPVNKTVTYGTVTGIPGESAKCWITHNLGADHLATSVNDATEAPAGWYWQFNKPQGYKHDGTTRTPNTAWNSGPGDESDWLAANDPCALLLGSGWHIPTFSEWHNTDWNGNWNNWNGPWNSALKMHAAGVLGYLDGTLYNRGSNGLYQCSTSLGTVGYFLYFYSTACDINQANIKSTAKSVRCVREWLTTSLPLVTTAGISNISWGSATGGGEVISDGGTGVTLYGLCWNTSPDPVVENSHVYSGQGTGVFVSYLTGLLPNTLYYVRAFATNSVGTAYGNEVSFTTSAPGIPEMTTNAVTNVTRTTATSGGNITSDGGAGVTARGVCWATNSNPTIADSHTMNGSGTGGYQSSLTGLSAGTSYYVRAYATNSAGTGYGNERSFTTLPAWVCGDTLLRNHVAGTVAPVNKTVIYGTVNGIPGETSKCWITRNLGASQQATAVNDASEASAGWYWQYNRQQGYKHDGSVRTPNTSWASINENSGWLATNDPCTLLLGNGWRIPTDTEWNNVDYYGGWENWNGPWSSPLKIHAAGLLDTNTGMLNQRGVYGGNWGNYQYNNTEAYSMWFSNSFCFFEIWAKATGFSVRCIKE